MTGLLEVLNDSHLQDMTLICCDGQYVRSNKILLSASSPYFRQVLAYQGKELYLPGVTSEIMHILLVFIYEGVVHVSQHQLPYVTRAATSLQIRGFQEACAMIPSVLPGDTKHKYIIDTKPEPVHPSKKRKLEEDINILESGSASLFRPWSVSVLAAKENTQRPVTNDKTSFMVPTLSMSPPMLVKPIATSRYGTPTSIDPRSHKNNSLSVSPNNSLDFAPLLASTMKNLVNTDIFAVPVSSSQDTNISVNNTTKSPIGWLSALGNHDISTLLAAPIEKITGKDNSSRKSNPASPMQCINSNDYLKPGSQNQFTTPDCKKSQPLSVNRTPLELLKADPSSVTEVLCGTLPLFDDSKDDTVVEYRDESDNEGNLIIDLEEPSE